METPYFEREKEREKDKEKNSRITVLLSWLYRKAAKRT
jgi:hypothetical protein